MTNYPVEENFTQLSLFIIKQWPTRIFRKHDHDTGNYHCQLVQFHRSAFQSPSLLEFPSLSTFSRKRATIFHASESIADLIIFPIGWSSLHCSCAALFPLYIPWSCFRLVYYLRKNDHNSPWSFFLIIDGRFGIIYLETWSRRRECFNRWCVWVTLSVFDVEFTLSVI